MPLASRCPRHQYVIQAICHASHTPIRSLRTWCPLAFIRTCRGAGTDPDWTRDLPLRLRRHGLASIDAELDVPLFRGGSAHARFWSLTWQQVRDRVIAVGEPAQVIDDGQADLADQQRWFTGPAMMTAWGQRPPG